MPKFDKVCLITKKTPLDGLKARYGAQDQARFVLEQRGTSFAEYERFDFVYQEAIEAIRAGIPPDIRLSIVDYQYLPTYQFDPSSLIVTVGPDGLVANTAKYLNEQPIIAVNPDPVTIDGVLARNEPAEALSLIRDPDRAVEQGIVMAEAKLADGQVLLAVNDLFIGQRTHVSARYRICFGELMENQSSSGIIVSTGAGSTGWRRSILTGALAVANTAGKAPDVSFEDYAFPPTERKLAFAVREPFISRASSATLVSGYIQDRERLSVVSQMPQNGVIFSDGVESDFLEFDSGAVASIGVSGRSVRLWSMFPNRSAR